MAKQVVKVGSVKLGGNDYSAQIANASINIDIETGDTTNFAGDGWKEFAPGLKGATLELEFKKDADMSGLDAAVWTAINGAGTLSFEAKLSSASTSAANPKWTGTVLITSWSVGPGQLGQVFGGSASWTITGAVTRATSDA